MLRTMIALWLVICGMLLRDARADELQPVRIAKPAGGHIHPAVCISPKGTLVVIYGQVNHRDLRLTRSVDGGRKWSETVPF